MSLRDLPKTDTRSKVPLRVTVLHALPVRKYQNVNKKDMAVLEAVVADNTGFSKLLCYNKLAFPMIKTGQSLMLLNVISKQREIVATSDSKFLLVPHIDIDPSIVTAAKKLMDEMVNPPAAEKKNILETLDLPPGSLVTVRVKLLQVEDVQTVTTSYGSETDVRNGVCGDETGSISFAFWRALASTPISVEDCIRINNAVVSKSTDGTPKLSGNQRTTIEFLAADAVEVVKGSSITHEEEGDVVAISNVNIYDSCSRPKCYQKNLIDKKCPKCLTQYLDDNNNNTLSLTCSVAIQKKDDIETLTLFSSQVKELMNNETLHLSRKF